MCGWCMLNGPPCPMNCQDEPVSDTVAPVVHDEVTYDSLVDVKYRWTLKELSWFSKRRWPSRRA